MRCVYVLHCCSLLALPIVLMATAALQQMPRGMASVCTPNAAHHCWTLAGDGLPACNSYCSACCAPCCAAAMGAHPSSGHTHSQETAEDVKQHAS